MRSETKTNPINQSIMQNDEKIIIGSCLTYEKCLAQAVKDLSKKDFQSLAPLFGAIKEFYKTGKDHEDIIFDVTEILKRSGVEHDLYNYIGYGVPSINQNIENVKDASLRRSIKEISDELYQLQDKEPDIKSAVVKCIGMLSELLNGNSKEEQNMSDVMDDTLKLIEKIRNGETLGMTCGLDIDDMLQGFQDGQFYILAARPSMGKTALAVQIAQSISLHGAVAFLSLETTNQSLGLRHLTNFAKIDGDKLRTGKITDNDFEKLKGHAQRLAELNIITDDTTDISAESLHAKVNYLKRKYDIKMLIVDYVQLLKSDKDIREQQVAEISRSCVAVAKEFKIPILGLAQLNRGVESRGGDKRPMMSDLRESGQLEQDAFCVMLLHRPEYYGIKQYPDGKSTDGIAEVIVAKHKDGKTGIKKLLFQKEFMRFENLDKVHPF